MGSGRPGAPARGPAPPVADALQLAPDFQTLRLRDATPEGQELWPWGWIVHRHASVSGWASRQGLFRVLVWTFLLKLYARGDFAEFLEIHGLPLRVGKYPAGTDEEEIAALLAALRDIGHDAAGAILDTMLVEFHEAARQRGALHGHARAVRKRPEQKTGPSSGSKTAETRARCTCWM